MSSTYVDVADYQSSPRTTDPVDLLAEERIRSRFLRSLLSKRDAELIARERMISELYAESNSGD